MQLALGEHLVGIRAMLTCDAGDRGTGLQGLFHQCQLERLAAAVLVLRVGEEMAERFIMGMEPHQTVFGFH